MEKKYGYTTALSFFKALYEEKENNNIYKIIKKFVLIAIKRKNIVQFSSTELSCMLKDEFDFDIPEAVLKTSLKDNSLFELSYHEYSYVSKNEPEWVKDIEEKYSVTLNSNEKVLNKIQEFIYDETGKEKSLQDVNSYLQALLISGESSDYVDLVSKFIVMNKDNSKIIEVIDSIKAGYIIYNGLKYSSPNENIYSTFKSTINLYFTTDMLFSFYGYNGELYANIFDEFFNLVKEVNQNSKKGKKFKLFYFSEISDEIDRYFEKAKAIKRNEDNIDPTKTAMVQICQKSKNESDVVIERNKFYKALEISGFQQYVGEDFYCDNNHQYNLIETDGCESLCKSVGLNSKKENIYQGVSFLNYINILRKGKSFDGFEKCEHVLVTSNSSILKLSLASELKKNRNFPLATSTDYITNRLWIKLNKGFGNGKEFASYHSVTIAQLALSSKICNKIGSIYEEMIEKVTKGEIDEEVANKTILEFKSHLFRPEQIDEKSINQVCFAITADTQEKYQELSEAKAQQLENSKARNTQLEKQLKNIQIELDKSIEINKSNNDIITNLDAKIDEKDADIESMQERLARIEELDKRRKKNWKKIIKISLITIVVAIIVIVSIIIYNAYFNDDNFITSIISTLAVIVPILVFLINKFKKTSF